MANVLILGGGFAGVVAAESLAKRLGKEHQVTLISRQRDFIFYPALVKLAFGQVEVRDISYDLREAMLDRNVKFIEAEVAYPDPTDNSVIVPHGEVEGKVRYDYLLFALGRRMATEEVSGFFDYGNHLLTVNAALEFRTTLQNFHAGHAVLGYCQDARLTVPVFETAFALDRMLKERGERDQVRITIIVPGQLSGQLGGPEIEAHLQTAMQEHGVEFIADFVVNQIKEKTISAANGQQMDYDLLMLIPPFTGPAEAQYTGIADPNGYVRVDRHMRVTGAHRMYAAGDCVNFVGPKMGHMAVLQGMVAAANIAAELEGHEPVARYNHELMLVIDEGGRDSIYLQKPLWEYGEANVKQGRFWGWAKRVHQKYWQKIHA
ncbi:MAG TPA: FAD-dependent oxidoreductase [Blastocatellia bacterium]|nr:FAD-dependent oxidoreductase [Blastocatellia bacterium]